MKTDGNVIHADFGKPEVQAPTLPQMSFTCEVLYADAHARLIRMTYRLGDQVYLQHVASGVGLDD